MKVFLLKAASFVPLLQDERVNADGWLNLSSDRECVLLEFVLLTPGVVGQGLSKPGHEDTGIYEVHDLKSNYKKIIPLNTSIR